MSEKNYWSEEKINQYLDLLDEYNSKEDLKVDMHNHTFISDGIDSPLMLLLRAHRMGLKTISITDHNSVNGYYKLREQIEKIICDLEELDNDSNLSYKEKQSIKKRAKRLLEIIENVNIIPGCEILTVYKGCPYVEILAYGIDIETLDAKLKEASQGLDAPGEVLCQGLKDAIKKYNLKVDEYFIDNRSDYRKLFFHELIRHPENAYLYGKIEGETEEEKAQNFAKEYIDNPESTFYVDLNNSKTRKSSMVKMIENNDNIVFDTQIIKNAGSSVGQFYTELLKYPENKALIDPRIDSLKKFNYLGVYNEKSPFFVDLSRTKPSLETVINLIHESSGKALVAHWGRYISSNKDVFDWKTEQGRSNLEEIIEMCDGAECSYPDNPIELRRLMYNICREKGKIISIGGDNHGKSGKEGAQYMLGSQTGKTVEELEWIKNSVVEGKEIITQLEEEYHYKKRLKDLLNGKNIKTQKDDEEER